jgi:gliding motility-associated-like protein
LEDFHYLPNFNLYIIQAAMRKIILFGILGLSIFNISIVNAQTCFGAFAGADINLPCNTLCTPFTAQIPEIKSTEKYTVNSIPYTPYAFVTSAPLVQHPCTGGATTAQDDKYFASTSLPFNFCFYGTTYNYGVIGSNGVISFDLNDALKGNTYIMSNSIPFIGTGTQGTGACPSPGGTKYPHPAIFGLYYDIWPVVGDPYKIEQRVEGTSPCRRWVVSFNNVKLFDCPGVTTTFQMVMYESTNIVEVYVQDKPICNGGNAKAIIGIQDLNAGPSTLSAPGRNLFQNNISNEAWQFKPDGSSSLLDHVELVLNGGVIATGTLGSLTNGYYDVDFGNVCPPAGINQYVVRGVYKVCNDNPATFYFIEDTVEINRIAPFFTNGSTTNPLCKGLSTGQVVFNPIGTTAPYDYSKDGGVTYVTNNTFTGLAAGTYNFKVRDVNGCVKDTAIIITEPTQLTASAITTSATCPNNDGSIDITAGGGTPAYEYSINNGVNYQASNQFVNLPIGNYNNIRIRDANGCITPATAIIVLNDTMRLELGADSTICFGSSITLIPQTNTLTDTFKWTPKASLNFDTVRTPIATPTDTTKYYLTAKWGLCTRQDSITVKVLHKPVANAGKDTTVCYKTNATLFGSASNLSGTVNFAWSPPDSLNSPNTAVTGVRLDTTRQFTLTVTDNYGCNFSVTDSVTIFMQPELYAFAGNDTIAIINRDHQLLATGRNAVDFVWSPIAPLNNPFIANPVAIINHDTYFYVHVTDAIGCTDDDTIFIKVYDGPTYYLPTAFTPNGDGLNDIFFPTPVGIRSTDYFRVFDRYGKLMYQTNQWLKGKKASSGTYVWMIKGIDKNGSVVEMRGTVILLR